MTILYVLCVCVVVCLMLWLLEYTQSALTKKKRVVDHTTLFID